MILLNSLVQSTQPVFILLFPLDLHVGVGYELPCLVIREVFKF